MRSSTGRARRNSFATNSLCSTASPCRSSMTASVLAPAQFSKDCLSCRKIADKRADLADAAVVLPLRKRGSKASVGEISSSSRNCATASRIRSLYVIAIRLATLLLNRLRSMALRYSSDGVLMSHRCPDIAGRQCKPLKRHSQHAARCRRDQKTRQ